MARIIEDQIKIGVTLPLSPLQKAKAKQRRRPWRNLCGCGDAIGSGSRELHDSAGICDLMNERN